MEYPTPVILTIPPNIVFNLVLIKSKMALPYQLTPKGRKERALYN